MSELGFLVPAFKIVVLAVGVSILYLVMGPVLRLKDGALWRGLGVLWNLVGLWKALRLGKSRAHSTLRMRGGQLLLSCYYKGAFVQVSFGGKGLGAALQERSSYRIAVGADGTLFERLSQQGRSAPTVVEPVGTMRVWTGDQAFDSSVEVVGPEPLALALLNHERRMALLRILGQHWSRVTLQVAPAVLCFAPRLSAVPSTPAPTIHTHLHPTLVALAPFLRALSIAEADILPALAANAASDVSGRVRRRNLETLLHYFPGAPQAEAALASAIRQDPAPNVRVWVAKHVGGSWGFAELIRLIENEGVGSGLWLEISEHLLEQGPSAEVLRLFVAMLHRSTWSERPTILQAIYRDCGAGDKLRCITEQVTEYLLHCRHKDAVETIDFLAHWGNQSLMFEQVMLALMAHEHPDVRLAAVHALGSVGTQRSLPVLAELTADAALGEAAESAIRTIQGVAGQEGQLSLTEVSAKAGAVSVAETGGGLAFAEDDKDR